jgi:hypothetical protein
VPGDRPKGDRPCWADINTLSSDEEYGMPMDSVARFLAALNPQDRQTVDAEPRDEQERLAAAWEIELEADAELDTLDELSPAAAEAEAARRVLDRKDG